MKIAKFKIRNSIFNRLVVTFLIILIPIYMLGIYMYNWSLHTVKGEISQSAISQVSAYLEGLDKEIERIKILQYDCLNDEYLNKLAIRWEAMNLYERTESMRLLQQRLVSIKNSSIYIKNVSVHILPIKRSISTNSGVDTIDMEKYKYLRVPKGTTGAQIINFKGGLFLSTIQQSNSSDREPLYLIEIELSQDAFKQALAQFNTYKDGGSVLVSLINDGTIIKESDDSGILSKENILPNINKKDSYGMKFMKIGPKDYYVVYVKSKYLNMTLFKYIPKQFILEPLQNFSIWVWVSIIVSICIIVIYSLSTYKVIHKPLLKLISSFHEVENGDLKISIKSTSSDEFGYLYDHFNDMVRNLNMLIDQVYNQKILTQRAELKQLQSQINPHFLYNSFFMINTMARVGDENLVEFTKQLGEYFRFVTRNSSDYIPLMDEINHARVYTKIQLMRFSKRLQINFAECPEKYKSLQVPRLIIQPIIENSFEHSVENKKSDCIIRVSFEEAKGEINIVVEDNGNDIQDYELINLINILKNDDNEVNVTGIINIHRRIRLVFGDESGLILSRSELGGLKVVVKIKQ